MLSPKNTRWDKTAEIVIIGYGLAGVVAAIIARDCGASVLILEKQSALHIASVAAGARGGFLRPEEPVQQITAKWGDQK